MGDWKETEFGRIPVEWDLITINDLKAKEKYAISMGPFGSNIKAENFVSNGVPVIRGTNLNFEKYVDGEFVFLTEEKADELLSSNCKPDDLVFTHRGTIGQVGIVPQKKYLRYVISQSGMKLSVDKNKIDNHFLFYFFKSKFGQHQLLKSESQVGVPSINTPLTTLKEIEVPIPKISEQQSIASILSSLDDKIELLHSQNKTLEALAETLFRMWFVEAKDESWEVGKLGNVIELVYGKGLKEEIRTGIGFPVIGSSGIVGYHDEYLVCGPGIVIGRKGTLGKVIYLYENFYPIDTTYFVKTKINSRELLFEYFLLKSINFEDMNSDSAVPGLNREIALSTELSIPPENKINEFNGIASTLFYKIKSNLNQIHTLTQLRDTLLPKLMSGEVRVII